MKRIGMMKIKDILRHRHDFELPRAQIAAAVGVSTGTVSHVLARAEAAGLSWPLPSGLDDEALRARLYPAPDQDSDPDAARLGCHRRGAHRAPQAPPRPADAAPALGRIPGRGPGAGGQGLYLQPLLRPAEGASAQPARAGADALPLRAGAVGPVGLLGQGRSRCAPAAARRTWRSSSPCWRTRT